MTVTFYSGFSKRINSTKQPVSGTDHDCKLKEDCSEHDPVLILQSTAQYDYAYISAWGKYYFVRDIVSKSYTISECHLSEDVLATYKSYIGSTSARVVYAASAVRDPWLVDSRIQIKNSRVLDRKAGTSVFGAQKGYIVTVYADEASVKSSGFSVSYLLSDTGMDIMRDWFGRTDAAGAFRQYFNGTPLQAVFSCKVVPYFSEIADSGSGTSPYTAMASNMYIADRSSSLDSISWGLNSLWAFKVARPILSGSYTFNLSNFGYSDFRRFEPYTRSFLYLPGIGCIAICRNEITSNSLEVKWDIDVITGDIKYTIWSGNNIISECNGNVACDCPLGQMVMNSQGVMTSIGATVGGAVSLAGAIAATVASEGATAPMIAGAAAATIAGVANTVLSYNQHTPSITGTNSNILVQEYRMMNYYELSVDTEDPTDSGYVALKGYPHAGTAQISSFSGFVQCEGASVSCPGNASEKEEINNYLNTGFFYE